MPSCTLNKRTIPPATSHTHHRQPNNRPGSPPSTRQPQPKPNTLPLYLSPPHHHHHHTAPRVHFFILSINTIHRPQPFRTSRRPRPSQWTTCQTSSASSTWASAASWSLAASRSSSRSACRASLLGAMSSCLVSVYSSLCCCVLCGLCLWGGVRGV